MDAYKYVILGGGMVAGYAARAFVEGGVGRGELCILSGDGVRPYERPPLSKGFLAGADSEDSIFINAAEFYSDHGIEVRVKTHVTRADLTAKRLQLSSGDEVGFEKLLIATGAVVRTLSIPGSDLSGIQYLRSFDDSKALRDAYKGATHAVVLGAGFIGLEVASVLATAGVQTTMLFPEERVWQRFFAPEMSAFFEQYYTERGVAFVKGDTPASIEGADGNVRELVTSGGRRLPADVVVAGIGVTPALAAVKDSGLTIENGIVVNEYLETGIDGVYAAGDVANYRDVVFETQRRAEHWDNAVEQGGHVAKTMLGDRQPFVHVPYFFSDVFDLSYEFWGDTSGADAPVYRGDVTTNSFSAWWLRDGRLRAAFVMNRPDEERDAAPAWIAEHREVDAGRLADASAPLH
jgi:NADPH-dependent 2,4-dienoyl-CoA reductase/sulfur reductase-like enzyme